MQQKSKTLYNLMECATCTFRMISEPGCFKFGLTKNEINRGYQITLSDNSSFELSSIKPCPYAFGIEPEVLKKDK